jgi:hypothetical protein
MRIGPAATGDLLNRRGHRAFGQRHGPGCRRRKKSGGDDRRQKDGLGLKWHGRLFSMRPAAFTATTDNYGMECEWKMIEKIGKNFNNP